MNTLKRLTPAVMIAAACAAVALAQGGEAAVLPAPVVLMPTVQVSASRDALRTEVVQLPLVTVVGKREAAAPTRMAQRGIASRS